MNYTSRAHREGEWWIVQNDQHPGAISQVRRLDRAATMQREAIAFVADVDHLNVEVTVRVELDPELARSLDEAAVLRSDAQAKETRALELRRSIALALASDGMTVRDIGAVLGVSHQRAHQLITSSKPATRAS